MKLETALQTLRDVIRRKHLALATEETYVHWVSRFSRFVLERCQSGSPAEKMEAFLGQLARQDVSASTQNQAFCALLFFYREVLKVEVGKVAALRAKKPVHLRYAPELGEVRQLLGGVAEGHKQLDTTMGYLHADALSVRSPLEFVA